MRISSFSLGFTMFCRTQAFQTSWLFSGRSNNIGITSRAKSRQYLGSLSAVNEQRPSVAVVGSGAVGAYYGSRLWETGADVKFHMRGEHYEKSKSDGLNVTSVHGDMFIPPSELQAFTDTSEIGKVDWVIVALKSSALEYIPGLISPLLEPGRTRVLAIMNGLIEEDLIQLIKEHEGEDADDKGLHCCAALYGGMALVCSNRIGPGHIDHSYAGLLSGGVAACSPEISKEENQQAYESLWSPANVEIAYEPSILSGRWRKNVWNLPFNGISVAMGGITVDKIVTDPGLRQLAYDVANETIAIANADLRRNGVSEDLFLGEKDTKQMFDLSDGMGPYRTSTMIDFVERRPMEVKYLFRKPIDRAAELGVPAPHLETLVAQIEAFQRFYNLF